MKKIWSVILSIALILTVFAMPYTVNATDPLTLGIGEVTGVYAGNVIDVPITISNNPGINIVAVTLKFSTNLTFIDPDDETYEYDAQPLGTGTKKFEIVLGASAAGKQPILFNGPSNGDVKGNGNLAVFKFKINETAKVGDAVNISISVNSDGEPVNFDEEDIPYAVGDGFVSTVECKNHIWDEGTVTKPQTCEENGIVTYHCTVAGCTGKKTEELTKFGHDYSLQWSTDSNSHWYKCSRCDIKKDFANHLDENIDGICDVCGYTKLLLGIGEVNDIEPDAIIDVPVTIANNAGINVIGITLNFSENLTFINPDDGDGYDAQPLGTGTKKFEIIVGGATAGKQSILFNGPSSGDVKGNGNLAVFKFKVDKNAKIGDTVLLSVSVKSDGEPVNYNEESIDYTIAPQFTGLVECIHHIWDEGEITVPSTCTVKGTRLHTCTRCGETKTEEIELAPHTYEEWLSDDTHHYHQCSVCHEILDEAEHIDEDDNGICDVCGRELIAPGDATGDGKIDSKDLVRLKKYLAGQDVEVKAKGGDATGDGKIDSKDLVRLKKYLAGQSVVLGKS